MHGVGTDRHRRGGRPAGLKDCLDLRPIEEHDLFEYFDEVHVDGGTWIDVAHADEDLFWNRDEILRQLVALIGRPALCGLTIDSDFLGIVGRTPDGEQWSGVVDAEGALAYRIEGIAEGFDDVVPEFGGPTDAVAGAVRRARAAGLRPDEVALGVLFSPLDREQPAEAEWPALLAALGLQENDRRWVQCALRDGSAGPCAGRPAALTGDAEESRTLTPGVPPPHEVGHCMA